ncbi:MAG: P-loop NTPase [Acidimicrobiia bacterium]|nr:P-loop NTPase [Acidimicrobiia bacterium]
MLTHEDVFKALRGVFDPELGADIVELGMVQDVDITPTGEVTLGIALTIAECPMRSQIEEDTVRKVSALNGVTDVHIDIRAMTQKQRSGVMERARRTARDNAEPTRVDPKTRVIAVGSGKGGVGKSSVSVNLAVAISDLGYRVGLLDADIWGFSIPRMLGTTERLEANDEKVIIPVDVHGIAVVSTGLIVESEETALMWRGLMLSKALEQFLHQVAWGELDYLIIDLPPGTGDIQMALSRLLPQAEMVVVTTPQKAAQKVAIRVADMARRSYMPVVGVIENMAGFTCGHGETYDLFGSGGGTELAEAIGVPLIGQIPLDAGVVEGGDSGNPVARVAPDGAAGAALRATAQRVIDLVPPVEDETCTARIARLVDAMEASSA